MPRNPSIDHLRIALIALVILHHTAIVYGGSGGWYWRQEPDGSSRVLLIFNAVNQSYFMGLFFLLAGSYTPASFERKGAGQFLIDRLWRLGVPLALYFFVLSPLTIALGRMGQGHPFWSGWWLMIRRGQFEPGPLWFSEALLLFALAYVAWRALRSRPPVEIPRLPRATSILLASLAVALASFLIRLAVPTGKSIFWLQLGYFPPYVLLFVVGCMAARARVLEQVSFAQVRPWALLSAGMVVLFPFVYAARRGQGPFGGGWNANAAFYALWDPLTGWGIMLALFWAVGAFGAHANRFTSGMARGAYGAYIVHPPIVVALSLLARPWAAPPLAKFALVGIAACLASFAVAEGALRLPRAQRIL